MFVSVLALMLVFAHVAAVQDGNRPKRSGEPRLYEIPKREGTEFRPVAGKPFTSLPIPPGMTAGDVALFAKLMELTEEQRAALESLHAEYVAKNSAARRDVEQQLYERSSELASQRTGEASVELKLQTHALFEEAEALASRIETLDAWFMGEARVAVDGVTDVQIERMRLLRKRDVCHAYYADFKSAASDLCRLQLELDVDLAADAIDADALLAARIEYEQTRTNLMEQHRRASIQSRPLEVEFIRIMAQASALNDAGEEFDRASLHERSQELRKDARRPRIDAWRRMSDLNDHHIAALLTLAPGEASGKLATAYRVQAYPNIYPDEAHLRPVFDAIGAVEGIDAGIRDAVDEIQQDYVAQQESLSARLIAYYNDWFAPFRLTMTLNMFEFNKKGDGYFRLWEQRNVLAEDTWVRVREVLGPAQRDAIDESVQKWKEAVSETREKGPQHVSPYMTEAQQKQRDAQAEEIRRLRESGALSETRPTPK
jgi:hypothetical protein